MCVLKKQQQHSFVLAHSLERRQQQQLVGAKALRNWFKYLSEKERKQRVVCVFVLACVYVRAQAYTAVQETWWKEMWRKKKSELNETYEKAAIGRWIVFPRSTLGVVKKTYNFLYLLCCVYGGEETDEEPEHKDRTQSVSEGSHTWLRTPERKSDWREWKII